VAIFPDGRIVSASADGTVKLWNPPTFEVREMEEHDSEVLSVAVLPDGDVVLGRSDGTVKLWDPGRKRGDPTGKKVRTVAEHTAAVNVVAVAPGGRVASGSGDGTVKLWDPSAGQARTIIEHSGAVTGVAVLARGRVVSGGGDGMVKLWDPATGRVTTLDGPERIPPASGIRKRTGDYSAVACVRVSSSPVVALASNERGELAVVRSNGRVAILDVDLELICIGTLPAQPNGSAAWHPDGRQIAVGTTRGVAVFELRPLP
jgi:WD40 repeat protein